MKSHSAQPLSGRLEPSVEGQYRFVACFQKAEGEALDQRTLDVSWNNAVESVRFEAIRRQQFQLPDVGTPPVVEPEWDSAQGPPRVGGFRLRLRGSKGEKFGLSFPLAYFKKAVQRASGALVDRGLLKAGETFLYRVTAYPSEARRMAPTASSFSVEETAVELPIRPRSIESYADHCRHGTSTQEDDIPVFVPATVLNQTEALTRRAGARETGGVLIGHLNRDPASRELFLAVTAQIPAAHTVATSTRLTFTSETWTAVRRALELRRKEEIHLGWWHCHPAIEWCKNCPAENRKKCTLASGFFSPEDLNLHESIFPRAYSVALVTTHSEEGIRQDLFGWRKGMVVRRDFGILPQSKVGPPA
ncbi:MAG: hypothetical protein ACE5JX_06815 [Acidobacteriota bacterium]